MTHDLLTHLAEYGTYCDVRQGAVSADDVTDAVMPLPMPTQPTRPRHGWLIAAAAAIVIVVLIGGIGLLTRIQDNPDVSNIVDQLETEEPTVVEPVEPDEQPVDGDDDGETPRLTEDVPPGVESGTLTTPVGAARWLRLSGDDDPLPRSGQAIAWPSGFAIFVPSVVRYPAELWVSSDGVEWRQESLPIDPLARRVSFRLIGDVYWLLALDPAELWRSNDGSTWEEIEFGGQFQPTPAGLVLSSSQTALASSGDTTLLYASLEIGLSGEGDSHFEERLFMVRNRELVQVDIPWSPRSGDQGQRLHALFGAQDRIYAYGRDETDSLRVWSTSDGESWTDLGRPGFLSDTASSPEGDVVWPWFTSLNDSLAVTVFWDPSTTNNRVWETVDGVNWTAGPQLEELPGNTTLVPSETGWFAHDGSQGGFADAEVWWIHLGDEWISLAGLGIEDQCGGATVTAADGIAFFFGRGCDKLWILTLEAAS